MFAVGGLGNWVCNSVVARCLFSSAVTVVRQFGRINPARRAVRCDAWTFSNFRTAGGVMTGKSRRGFASMDPERQKEIASRGGRAAHEKGTAHEWSSDEARHAGRKGGVTVSQDRAHMAAIGREGANHAVPPHARRVSPTRLIVNWCSRFHAKLAARRYPLPFARHPARARIAVVPSRKFVRQCRGSGSGFAAATAAKRAEKPNGDYSLTA